MNPQALAQLNILMAHLADEKRAGEALSVRLSASKRDELESNQRLQRALKTGDDVYLIIPEVRDNLLEQAQVLTEFAEHASRMATLLTQSAHVTFSLLA